MKNSSFSTYNNFFKDTLLTYTYQDIIVIFLNIVETPSMYRRLDRTLTWTWKWPGSVQNVQISPFAVSVRLFYLHLCWRRKRGNRIERKEYEVRKRCFPPSNLSLSESHSGELRTQKLKSHLVRTQSSKVLLKKPWVGQYIAVHATLTARDFFLANFYPYSPFTCIFCKPLPSFSCVSCG